MELNKNMSISDDITARGLAQILNNGTNLEDWLGMLIQRMYALMKDETHIYDFLEKYEIEGRELGIEFYNKLKRLLVDHVNRPNWNEDLSEDNQNLHDIITELFNWCVDNKSILLDKKVWPRMDTSLMIELIEIGKEVERRRMNQYLLMTSKLDDDHPITKSSLLFKDTSECIIFNKF